METRVHFLMVCPRLKTLRDELLKDPAFSNRASNQQNVDVILRGHIDRVLEDRIKSYLKRAWMTRKEAIAGSAITIPRPSQPDMQGRRIQDGAVWQPSILRYFAHSSNNNQPNQSMGSNPSSAAHADGVDGISAMMI